MSSASKLKGLVPTRLGDSSASLPAAPDIVRHYEPHELSKNVLGAGDSRLHLDFLTREEQACYFNCLLREEEFHFQQWYHMPSKKGELEPLRRTKAALANSTAEGLIPHYRFPVNNQEKYGVISPMTPTVEAVRARASALLGCEFNHAVVLLYRGGQDCIGYHKDKTLDIDEEAPIASISLGYTRQYALRDNIKCPTAQQEFLFPSGSLFELGPRTNQAWYHSVRPEADEALLPLELDDTREGADATPVQKVRISLTFRRVSTFKHPMTGELSGKGAAHQSLNWPVEFNGEHRLDA